MFFFDVLVAVAFVVARISYYHSWQRRLIALDNLY